MAGYALTTSTTTTDIVIGTKTFAVTDVGDYIVGNRVRVSFDNNNYLEGTITIIAGTDVTVEVDFVAGSGTKNNWAFSLVGTQSSFGATGATGPSGGATGATGVAGVRGASGAKGATGSTGFGAPGLRGATGLAGTLGAKGATGLTGSAGATGAAGPKGATGAQAPGLIGTTGATGVPGIPGLFAAMGATGPQGVPGATGPNGPNGPTGSQGSTGPSGGSTGSTGATGAWSSAEIIVADTGMAGITVHDYYNGSTFYHAAVTANITANFTNIPIANNQSIVMVVMIKQGSAAFKITAIQINGTAAPINWLDEAVPIGSADKLDIYSFVLLRVDNAWIVTGQCASYG